ncbi:hypothetical protein CHUAL_012356 [Chamberlinius hualienensis]
MFQSLVYAANLMHLRSFNPFEANGGSIYHYTVIVSCIMAMEAQVSLSVLCFELVQRKREREKDKSSTTSLLCSTPIIPSCNLELQRLSCICPSHPTVHVHICSTQHHRHKSIV